MNQLTVILKGSSKLGQAQSTEMARAITQLEKEITHSRS
jgi:hypothetical protein